MNNFDIRSYISNFLDIPTLLIYCQLDHLAIQVASTKFFWYPKFYHRHLPLYKHLQYNTCNEWLTEFTKCHQLSNHINVLIQKPQMLYCVHQYNLYFFLNLLYKLNKYSWFPNTNPNITYLKLYNNIDFKLVFMSEHSKYKGYTLNILNTKKFLFILFYHNIIS